MVTISLFLQSLIHQLFDDETNLAMASLIVILLQHAVNDFRNLVVAVTIPDAVARAHDEVVLRLERDFSYLGK